MSLRKPCPACPFLKEGIEPVRLYPERVEEVWQSTRHDGGSFPCHKTVSYGDDGERRMSANEEPCMGATLSGIKSGDGPNQLARIYLRLATPPFTAEQIDSMLPMVFESEEEMMETALRPPTSRRKRRAK